MLCRTRANVVHPLLCIGNNPAILPLFSWIRDTEWMSVHALTHSIARVLLAYEKGEKSEEYTHVRSLVDSLAAMSSVSFEQRNLDIG
jgi:hypothetical protein